MRRETVVVVLLLIVVLLPMWFVALHGEPPSEEVEIDQSVTEMRPLEEIIDTPNKLAPSQVGVIVWVALFGLVAVLAAVHRFMDSAVRPDEPSDTDDAVVADGGQVGLPWFWTDDRWVVEYHDATDAKEGILAMGGLTILAIAFAALFTGEYLTLARTQYFGVYATGMFVSLALLTVAYYAWFLPHVEVAERRGH
ncbi:hypothetical protein C499_06455 [Halogeometricum borinquense DSM 11551]|uniref:Uncharacterized protein n=1 Tax=Halogeometricum borinquense (strain ATCC 700274 / DSM 11551 / JCM 10706 / KCTC 4070 / PR3) TaxID=469382 RepID=E4NV31_HALBP|nr:hypothetical protein [Halogeometricum borinquense]ADQ69020.1 hypothetical protein Hbor_35000 [Halogeometricum borinquense DSM 11551]ELY29478.1 hypothetical protein C499_06455 [Halogeometricum borinquense DSM 11551]